MAVASSGNPWASGDGETRLRSRLCLAWSCSMSTAHPLMARLEREIMLTEADRLSVNEIPFYLEDLKAGEGPSWAGDRPLRSFIVLKGLLSTSKTLRDGRMQITAFHIPGDMPDLQALHLEVLDSDIGALTNCTLAFMAHQHLRPFCERHPRLAAALWRAPWSRAPSRASGWSTWASATHSAGLRISSAR